MSYRLKMFHKCSHRTQIGHWKFSQYGLVKDGLALQFGCPRSVDKRKNVRLRFHRKSRLKSCHRRCWSWVRRFLLHDPWESNVPYQFPSPTTCRSDPWNRWRGSSCGDRRPQQLLNFDVQQRYAKGFQFKYPKVWLSCQKNLWLLYRLH